MKRKAYNSSQLIVNNSVEGISIETKLQRIKETKEPIRNAADFVFQERRDGVNPAHDIRADKFELAADAMDKAVTSTNDRRAAMAKKLQDDNEKLKNPNDGEGSTDGTR
ncbi:MAG: hypothetical protein [Microviridae sp.]|nr:MAG: hypothetical protein [Microviridae sp.]